MVFLLINAFVGVGLNIAEKTVVLAMEIVEAANPVKWLTDGGSARDILDASADLLNAIADFFQVSSITVAFHKLKAKISDLATRIEKNDDFLQDVKVLIERKTVTREAFEISKSRFIQQYKDYDPQVTKPELDEMGSLWENLIDATCEVIDGFDTAAASPIKGIVYGSGLCSIIKISNC